MDYEKIIELINSGPEGRAELEKIAAPEPLTKVGQYFPELGDTQDDL